MIHDKKLNEMSRESHNHKPHPKSRGKEKRQKMMDTK